MDIYTVEHAICVPFCYCLCTKHKCHSFDWKSKHEKPHDAINLPWINCYWQNGFVFNCMIFTCMQTTGACCCTLYGAHTPFHRLRSPRMDEEEDICAIEVREKIKYLLLRISSGFLAGFFIRSVCTNCLCAFSHPGIAAQGSAVSKCAH